MTEFKHLFQPITIGRMTVKNRLLMSAMSINFGVDTKGHLTDQLIQYMAERARGGVGMQMVGGGGVHPGGEESPYLPKLWTDECIPSLQRLAEAIRPFDCRCGVQIMHGGRQCYLEEKVAPSAIEARALAKGVPRALEIEEIREIVSSFGDAARRCREAGLDFIEIHAAHGYLINQFMSPDANIRTDEYGGSFENRTRFFMEILADIRTKCGDDFPVGVRMNGEDYTPEGWHLDEALKLAGIIGGRWADYLHVSGGVYGSTQLTIPSMYVEQGCFAHLAAAVKKKVDVPVIAVGRIKKPEMGDGFIRDGKADMIALGRSLLADPHWPNKVRNGRVKQIRPCIGCCLGCIHTVFQLEPGGCVVNPDVGREYMFMGEPEKTQKPKTLLVVGAGPGGLATARMAALRGHRVTVCEQEDRTGGALMLASMVPGRKELADILAFFTSELERLDVELRLNTPLDKELIDRVKPDTVVLATGSLADMPMLKGLFGTRMRLLTPSEVISEGAEAGRQFIVLGGNQVGLVLADYLGSRGKTVAVLHRKAHFGEEMSGNDRFYLRERLKSEPVTLYKHVTVEKITADGAEIRAAGQPVTLSGYDSIVLSDVFVPLREAANLLKKHDCDLHFIGDAKQPRHLMYAISEGEEIARAL